jgi:hypothetical protein
MVKKMVTLALSSCSENGVLKMAEFLIGLLSIVVGLTQPLDVVSKIAAAFLVGCLYTAYCFP